MDANSGGY